MHRVKNLLKRTLLVAGLLAATGIASARVEDAGWLTGDSTSDTRPAVSRGWVAWQHGSPSAIWLWDRSGGRKRKISSLPGTNQGPHNYKDRVVWECGFDPDGEICFFDGQRSHRLTRDTKDDRSPRLWGSAIVWVRDDQYLVLYDVRRRRVRVLADYASAAIEPGAAFAVRDNRARQSGTDDQRIVVAYVSSDSRGQPNGLLVYDGSSDTTTKITSGIDLQPALAGQVVAFSRYMRAGDNRSQEIFYFNRRTGRLTRVTNNHVQDNYPSVSGRYLVWTTNYGYADGALNVLDLQTGRRRQVVRNAAVWQVAAQAAGSITWWTDANGVHVYEPATGRTTTVSEDGEGADSDGSLVAWEAYNGSTGGLDIGLAAVR